MRFWDTGAIVPLLVREERSGMMEAILREDEAVAVWWGTPVEAASVFARLRRQGRLTQAEERALRDEVAGLAGVWTEMGPTEAIRMLAHRLLLRHPLRAADAFQLAAALAWAGERPEDHTVVCLDGLLRDAARTEGFAVLPTEDNFSP